MIGFTDLVQGQWSLLYDNMNRMTVGRPSAGPYNGLAFSWAYDPFGNRKGQTVSGSSSQPIQSTPSFTFTASATNHVDNGSYDAMGNLLADQLNHYAYDAEGRLCAAAPISGGATGYLYDAEGQRWAKGSLNGLSCNFSSNGFAAGPKASREKNPGSRATLSALCHSQSVIPEAASNLYPAIP